MWVRRSINCGCLSCDLSLLASGKDVALPTPYVTDEDGKELKSEDVEFVNS